MEFIFCRLSILYIVILCILSTLWPMYMYVCTFLYFKQQDCYAIHKIHQRSKLVPGREGISCLLLLVECVDPGKLLLPGGHLHLPPPHLLPALCQLDPEDSEAWVELFCPFMRLEKSGRWTTLCTVNVADLKIFECIPYHYAEALNSHSM